MNLTRAYKKWKRKEAEKRGEPPTVHLIGVGEYPAKHVRNLEPGDTIVYNYGSTARLVSIEPVGEKSARLAVETEDGEEWEQLKRLKTLVAVRQSSE